jgi:prolipoprotein diacylglyceryltransferase
VPPVFPTPVYETITCGLLFLALWRSRKRIVTPGIMISVYLIMNGVERFLIEKIRVNVTYSIAGMEITQAEIISAALILVGIAMLVYFRNRGRHQTKANLREKGR